jgi:PAS domain S-box-containing protein
MTGYTKNEALNKKPSFLQGLRSDEKAKELVKKALRTGKPAHVQIYNYKKTGREYLCDIHIEQVYDHHHQLTNFIAFEREMK